MKTRLPIPMILVVLLAGVLPAVAQGDCFPPRVTPPDDPAVTAQQVESGEARLEDFAQAAAAVHKQSTQVQFFYLGCQIRQEDSAWRSGSTYLVSLMPDGLIIIHAKNMALSGRQLDPLVHGAILFSLGVSAGDLANLVSSDPDTAARARRSLFGLLSQEPSAAFDATPLGLPGVSGHASVYISANFGLPIILLAGFDLDETHLAEEEIEYGDPAVTAEDVVDRETLKAFVTEAGDYFLSFQEAGDFTGSWKSRVAARDENGPWRHGSVYLYSLDLTSNVILLHAAFPDRFELRPLIPTVRDAVTGQYLLPQVIEAARSGPEGGFVEYYFDDPTDDTDSADIPKVGYAREYTVETQLGGRTVPFNFIIGSGFYGTAPEVADGPRTEVEVTVLGDAVEVLTVEFSRAIAGRSRHFAWNATTDAGGQASLTLPGRQVSGFYQARARNASGDVVGQWHSIPLNRNRRQVLELTLGGSVRVLRAEPLAAAKAVAATTRLGPNAPNPFNSTTQIAYHLARSGPVELVMYNVLGQPVRTLVNEFQTAGSYQVQWDARDQQGASLSSGIYIARLRYPGGVQTRRLLYLR